MKKKEKMVCQIIRFLGKIETFLALIDVLQSICVVPSTALAVAMAVAQIRDKCSYGQGGVHYHFSLIVIRDPQL